MTWGKTVTTKFFLNTNLKPITVGERVDIYPLYVRVICKQQVSQFKYLGKNLEPMLLSKKEFGQMFGDGDLVLTQESSKAIAFAIVTTFKQDVEYLISFLDAFERQDFTIKRLPGLLKSYYDLSKSVIRIISSALIKEMMKRGFDSLVPFIDWNNQNPVYIEIALTELQEKFNLPRTKLDYEALPFIHVQQVLDLIKDPKIFHGSVDKIATMYFKKMDVKRIKGYEDLVLDILTKAITFYRSAYRMTGR